MRSRVTVALLFAFFAASIGAQAPQLRELDWSTVGAVPEPSVPGARSFLLVDVESAVILAARAPDLIIPPASLTKLVAIDVALAAIEAGEISLSQRFSPPESAWASNQPSGSSLMFLGPGQELTVEELLLGLVVSSGNDAAVALAWLLDGGVPAFVERMNGRASQLGLSDLFFVEPSGLSSSNFITARSFGRFLLAHLRRFPWVTERLYAVKEFTYPRPANQTGAVPPEVQIPPITQTNRNLLLRSDPSVDGLKTGFIEASGYNLAVTAVRDGRRVLAIILGIDAPNHTVGGQLRATAGASLLEYGYREFDLLTVALPRPRPVRIYGGAVRELIPEVPSRVTLSVPRAVPDLEGQREQFDALVAPVSPGVVGSVSVFAGELGLISVPMTVPAVEQAGRLRRAADWVVRSLRGLFTDERVAEGEMLSP